ncbi:hypothetical protein AB5J55_43115 [Streptomyces sp. R11]|uniref:Uncharacterized protein n=1 Tax=Streptomyces sp. R11 TaxID=3238625 RepID=A0AB39NBT7_9ACTN
MHHLLVGGPGIPASVTLTGGYPNEHALGQLLDKIPAVTGLLGIPRRPPDARLAYCGYDHDKYYRLLWQRGVRPAIAQRGQAHGTGQGIFRYVVERTTSWTTASTASAAAGDDATTSAEPSSV